VPNQTFYDGCVREELAEEGVIDELTAIGVREGKLFQVGMKEQTPHLALGGEVAPGQCGGGEAVPNLSGQVVAGEAR
jgi:hypothetical protein